MPQLYHQPDAGIPPDAIRIGRGSPWDNPFRTPLNGDAAAIAAQHARWLASQPRLLRALDELRGRDLVCGCATAPCHGALLLRLAAMGQPERLAWAASVTGP